MSYEQSAQKLWTERRTFQLRTARRNWGEAEPSWGLWKVPESELGVLGDVSGLDVVEVGCGTAYWSAWLARLGARPVAVDVTPSQLEIAARMQQEHGLDFPLVEANAEATGLPDASFDLAFSEYGASIWCDPHRWIPEAARLLRPGGRLVYLCNSTIAMLCAPQDEAPLTEAIHNDYFGMRRFDWPDGTTNFALGYGDQIRCLRDAGLELETMHEPQPPAAATTHAVYDYVTVEWARQWPSEEIWVARKAA